ncbi:DUF3551 domain-containing protein [Bradyrhizobium jicamae]|uniref:DUF3551 domain-containing protein n=1 Tax=Bradyrhizobium jicamae TaxID=280332 RepID=UPI002011147F|nr:DUF3551 domain-containing protein [Bradyrhizobium jicamae]
MALVGLAGADYLSVAPAVSTDASGYCLQDYSSAIRKCSFDTLEQCIVAISSRGGSCARHPRPDERPSMAAN